MWPLEANDPLSIGSYRLLGRLGSGGMGRVYLARSAGGRTVAVKVVHPHIAVDPEFRERFRREVRAARSVGSEWTAPVLDADPDAELPWVATGYVAGPSLQDAVIEHGPLPESSVRALGAGLAQALQHVHELGLVHRDVKPSNVLLTPDGPVLIDFGIARAGDGTTGLTSSGVSLGSPGYMSPEQALGERVGQAADLFSTGAVLAYAATGLQPFTGGNSAVLLYQVVHEEPDVEGLEELDADVGELIMRCLAKEPGVRPSSQELARGLAGQADGAASLVRNGWLPGAILQQVSRQTVELLALEPAAEPGAQPGDGSGAARGPETDATFALAPRQGPAGSGAPGVTGSAGTVGPVEAVGSADSPAEGVPPEAANARAPRRRRGLHAAVAAVATVAVLLGAVLLVRDDGDTSGRNAGPASSSSSSSPKASEGTGDSPKPSSSKSTKDTGSGPTRGPAKGSEGPRSDVPSSPPPAGDTDPEPNPAGPIAPRYIGQWQGDFVKREYQAEGSVRMTVAQGEKGERAGQGAFSFATYECPFDWQLVSAGPQGDVITLQAATRESGPSAQKCAPYAGAYDLRAAAGESSGAEKLRMRRAGKGETEDLAVLSPGVR